MKLPSTLVLLAVSLLLGCHYSWPDIFWWLR